MEIESEPPRTIEGFPSKEYQAIEVEKEYKRDSALFTQALALIFFLLYCFVLVLDLTLNSSVIDTIETIISGIVLAFSTLATLVILVHSWSDITGILRFSLSVVFILVFIALIFDALNQLAAAMFHISFSIKLVQIMLIIVLMFLPLSLFPGLFLSREDLPKSNLRALWLLVFSVIPLLLLRILLNPAFQ